MEQSPSWEFNRSLASQQNSPNFMEPESLLPYSQEPATYPKIEPVHAPHPTSLRSTLILSSNLRLSLPSRLIPSDSLTKTMYAPPLSPYMLHALPISVLTGLPE
jgi:hypothetical protein